MLDCPHSVFSTSPTSQPCLGLKDCTPLTVETVTLKAHTRPPECLAHSSTAPSVTTDSSPSDLLLLVPSLCCPHQSQCLQDRILSLGTYHAVYSPFKPALQFIHFSPCHLSPTLWGLAFLPCISVDTSCLRVLPPSLNSP